MTRILIIIITNLLIGTNLSWAQPPKEITARAPYYCNGLQLKKATKTPQGQHNYHFAGICQVKTPGYQQWIYKQVWLDIDATWDPVNNIASENAVVTVGGTGRIRLSLKCEGDPWTTNSSCLVKEFTNTSEFDNFAARFKVRKKREGVVVLANYPPLARFVASGSNFHEAPESKADHTQTVPPETRVPKSELHSASKLENQATSPTDLSKSNLPKQHHGDMPQQLSQAKLDVVKPSLAQHDTDQHQLAHNTITQKEVVHVNSAVNHTETKSQARSTVVTKPVVNSVATPSQTKSQVKTVAVTRSSMNATAIHSEAKRPTTSVKPNEKSAATHNKTKNQLVHTAVMKPKLIKPMRSADSNPKAVTSREKYMTYQDPKYKGHRIAWCYHWGNQCGKAAADAYCKEMSYTQAKEWKIALNVGESLIMGDSRMCLHKECSGFKMIGCERK